MLTSTDALERLNREFLGIRARLVELAAALDRIERGQGSAAGDPRMEQIGRSLTVLAGSQPDRVAQIQRIFSLAYDPQWKAQYAIPGLAHQ